MTDATELDATMKETVDPATERVANLILRLLSVWARAVSRTEIEAGLVLLRNDALRANVLADRNTTGLRGQMVSRVGAALKLLEERGHVGVEAPESGGRISLQPGMAQELAPADAAKAKDAIEAAVKLVGGSG